MASPDSNLLSLNQLSPGTRAVLASLGGERGFRRRLMEMGLVPGTRIRVVRRVEVGGLVQLEVRGCSLSLRVSEGQHLFFRPEPAG